MPQPCPRGGSPWGEGRTDWRAESVQAPRLEAEAGWSKGQARGDSTLARVPGPTVSTRAPASKAHPSCLYKAQAEVCGGSGGMCAQPPAPQGR